MWCYVVRCIASGIAWCVAYMKCGIVLCDIVWLVCGVECGIVWSA